MVYRGHIENGHVVFDDPARLADGTEVEIHILTTGPAPRESVERPWLKYLGIVGDLPPDASMTVDQVLYGRPDE